MERSAARGFTLSLFLVFAAGLAPLPGQTSSDTAPVTAPKSLASQAAAIKFGDYPAGSQASYDTWVRSSLYLKMRDGVRLATDVYLISGQAGPFHAVLVRTPYGRANGMVRRLEDKMSHEMLEKFRRSVLVYYAGNCNELLRHVPAKQQ